jgi:hypothetical protein
MPALSSFLAGASVLLALTPLASAVCVPAAGRCAIEVHSWIELLGDAIDREIHIYDPTCREIGHEAIGGAESASVTSELPWTVEFSTDGSGGTEPTGTIRYGDQTVLLPGDCETCGGLAGGNCCYVYVNC